MAEGLHPLLSARWSPMAFDTGRDLTPGQVDLLLEAARWSPSAGNSQPWAFLVARRGEPDHTRLVSHLAGSSSRWAPSAALLVVNLSHRLVAESDLDYSEFSAYDLGQAVAHMSVQATAMGLHVRQFRAFDRDGIADDFDIPRHWEPTTMSAIGHAPPGATADDDGPLARRRRPSVALRWPEADDEPH